MNLPQWPQKMTLKCAGTIVAGRVDILTWPACPSGVLGLLALGRTFQRALDAVQSPEDEVEHRRRLC